MRTHSLSIHTWEHGMPYMAYWCIGACAAPSRSMNAAVQQIWKELHELCLFLSLLSRQGLRHISYVPHIESDAIVILLIAFECILAYLFLCCCCFFFSSFASVGAKIMCLFLMLCREPRKQWSVFGFFFLISRRHFSRSLANDICDLIINSLDLSAAAPSTAQSAETIISFFIQLFSHLLWANITDEKNCHCDDCMCMYNVHS